MPPHLITLTDPRSPASEAFRTLRTNVMFAGVEKPIHTLVITSPVTDEGKSTTLANLAVTLAQGGHRTLLVDADLRRPTQHTIWGIPNEHGLTSLLIDKSLLSNPPLQAVGIDNLKVMTSGPLPPNPADLILSQAMDEAIAALKTQAEYVLFDAPPVLAVSDVSVLAAKLDGLLLVLKAGSTRRDQAERARDTLQRLHVRVIGVALTNAPRESGNGAY